MDMFLGLNIKYLRKKEGFTLNQFGKILEIAGNQVGKYERGESEPPLSKCMKMAEYFGVSMDDFLFTDLSKNRYQLPPATSEAGEPDTHYLRGIDDPVVRSLITRQEMQIQELAKKIFDMYTSLKSELQQEEEAEAIIEELKEQFPELREYLNKT